MVLEIRADEHAPPAYPDGGHNAEQTRAIAEALSEAARLLNYATMPEKRGLKYPADVYSVLGTLAGMAHSLPQALGQMSAWINREVAEGAARENPSYGRYGGDAGAAATALASVMAEASGVAANLGKLLSEAQSTMTGMESARPDPAGELDEDELA